MSGGFLVVLVLAVSGIAAAILLLHRYGRRWVRWLRLRGGHIKPRYPVVLLHGAFGFGEIRVGSRTHQYFRGVQARLGAHGVEVHVPRLPAVASVSMRAARLAETVRHIPSKRVNIIAHSMGGLDARYAIARLGLADRVCSLVTIGTPHHGTPIADVGASVAHRTQLHRVLGAMGAPLFELTRERMRVFNDQVPDAPKVFYASVVACLGNRHTTPHLLLRPTHALLRRQCGDNDGLVPVASQAWGKVIARVDADHWAQIGWGGDCSAIYEGIVRELRARGL